MDFSGYNREKERAARVVYEIIQQNGGQFRNKTNLFKAFWKAHLNYHESTGGYLTGWPIVRMPNGPGIDNFEAVMGHLLNEGLVAFEEVQAGGRAAFVFRIEEKNSPAFDLQQQEIESVASATREMAVKSAQDASHDSHLQSRSWQESRNGQELNIYLDLLDNSDRDKLDEEIRRMAESAYGSA